MYEAHRHLVDSSHRRRARALSLSKTRKDRIAQHIYVGLINDVIYELEHVVKSTVQNIKKKLNTYEGHAASKKLAKSKRSRTITEVIIIVLRMYLFYRS